METNHRRKMQAVRCALASGSAWIVLLACADVQAGGPCRPGWSDEFASCHLLDNVPLFALRILDTQRGQVAALAGAYGGWTLPSGRQQVCFRENSIWRSIHEFLPYESARIVDLAELSVGGTSPLLIAVTSGQWSWQRSEVYTWNGASWDLAGDTPPGQRFLSAAVFDDGAGPALYISGSFCEIGGIPICNLARWRGPGHDWEPVASITAAVGDPVVRAVRVLDDGSSPALYIGGTFDEVNGMPAVNIARWDGTHGGWSSPGGGVPSDFAIHALIASHEISAGSLHAGGSKADQGVVFRLDGGQWSQLGGPLGPQPADTLAAGIIDNVPSLFAAARGNLHHWDGSDWALHTEGFFAKAVVLEEGDGTLIAAGSPAGYWAPSRLVSWTSGASWKAEATGFHMVHSAYSVQGIEHNGTRSLYMGGVFNGYNNVNSLGGLRWDGQEWHPFGGGRGFAAGAIFDDGSGPALYGSPFECIAHSQGGCTRFARWDGQMWVPVAPAPFPSVREMVTLNDSTGSAIYFMDSSHPNQPGSLQRWDGTSLEPLDSPPGPVWALAVFDDGSGPALYSGGTQLLRWDKTQWVVVGGGVWQDSGSPGQIRAITAVEDGARPGLYVGGYFARAADPSGIVVNHIARWDGSSWSALGEGLPAAALDHGIAVMNRGPAQSVLVISATDPRTLQHWDGQRWNAIEQLADPIYALHGWDDGRGPSAWMTGKFYTLGGISSQKLARYVPCLCYANCDGSTAEPVLNIDDVICFINRFSEAQSLPPEQQINHYANCDGSTTPPVLNIDDFLCFIEAFAAGCQ